jgi:hypothetical protein
MQEMISSGRELATQMMSPAIQVSQTDLGIGDIICSLYALEGFSRELGRPPIRLFLRDHLEWMTAVSIPNLEVQRYAEADEAGLHYRLGDSPENYRDKLRGNHDPKRWYAAKLGGFEPMRPALNPTLAHAAPPFPQPYVVFAPFATRVNRTWEVHNWRLLAYQLKEAGYYVVALDAPHQQERCSAIGVDYWYGQLPAWTINVCQHAALIISNDSALAHLGGLLSQPTLVLLSQLSPDRQFSDTANHFITPNHACVGCRFQPELGYEEKCDYGCWALQSISPATVASAALKILAPSKQISAKSGSLAGVST